MEKSSWAPQPGPQTLAFRVDPHCDGIIYGGQAGGGKTAWLLACAALYVDFAEYYAMIFRRSEKQVTNSGGMWDESYRIYQQYGNALKGDMCWEFEVKDKNTNIVKGKSTIKFGHLNVAGSSHYDHQGAQYAFIGFDELTHFEREQFFYLLSRLRTVSGARTRWRATCNPDSQSWVRKFIDWWIDPITGFAIKERSGVIRYWVNISNGSESKIYWADNPQELKNKYGDTLIPQSFTFIHASLADNKILVDADPRYLSNLQSLTTVERERLLNGNWNIDYSDYGVVLQRQWFKKYNIDELLTQYGYFSYCWFMVDTAVTKKESSDYSVLTLFAKTNSDHNVYILDMIRVKEQLPDFVNIVVEKWNQWSTILGKDFHSRPSVVGIENTQAGIVCNDLLQNKGIPVSLITPRRDKYSRLSEVLGIIKSNRVHLPETASWASVFLEECECFRADMKHVIMNNETKPHDDMVDCLAYGLNKQHFEFMDVKILNNPDIISEDMQYMQQLTYREQVQSCHEYMQNNFGLPIY
jgi:predicted phage terminase large subunit-like protein